MIRSITMKNCASYDQNGIVIDNCNKVNFIYGPNGSGKSTISNFLQSPNDMVYQNSAINWSGMAPQETLVYNRKFRERNFGGSDIAGVFTLGAATKEDIQKVEQLEVDCENKQKMLDSRIQYLTQTKQELAKLEDDFKSTAWNAIYKNYVDDFGDVFSGVKNSRQNFAKRVLDRYAICHSSSETFDALKQRASVIFGEQPSVIDEIKSIPHQLVSHISQVEPHIIWSTIIVGNNNIPISSLIQHLDNADWVNAGRKYLHDSDVCPFCQQSIDAANLLAQIDDFFSGEYDRNVQTISTQSDIYDQNWRMLSKVLDEIAAKIELLPVGFADEQMFEKNVQLILSVYQKNQSAIDLKKNEPSRIIQLEHTNMLLSALQDIIDNGNQQIKKHNQIALNHRAEKEKLIDDVWAYILDAEEKIILGYLDEKKRLEKRIEGLEKTTAIAKQELETIQADLRTASANVTSVQPTVDNINRSLRAYGFTNFKIAPSPAKKNFYQIQRPDGSLVTDTLSEGEETFLTFLYFMQLTDGSQRDDGIKSGRVVVFDDPISSLDSTILYIVSAMIKSVCKQVKDGKGNISQVFILTHNVFFHKEVSFVNGRIQEENSVHYWVLRKDVEASSIKSFGVENPIKTSYELLWQELRDNTCQSSVTIQNTMRRIVENYFGMLGAKIDSSIANKFDTIEDKLICDSLFYWMNDGSHTIPDDLYIDSYSASISKYKEVFRKVFIFTGHEEHYKMMMRET